MSCSHIKVPEEMIKAVDKAIDKARIEQANSLRHRNGELYPNNFEAITLETALAWLYDKLDSLERKPYDDALAHAYNTCIADVRGIFKAPLPEPDLADKVIEATPCYGYTPTHAELDKLWEHYFRAGHGWVQPELRKNYPSSLTGINP